MQEFEQRLLQAVHEFEVRTQRRAARVNSSEASTATTSRTARTAVEWIDALSKTGALVTVRDAMSLLHRTALEVKLSDADKAVFTTAGHLLQLRTEEWEVPGSQLHSMSCT
jgi:hypothetical protein